MARDLNRTTAGMLVAAALGLAAAPVFAQLPAWKEACIAIQPTVPCTPDNRIAVEEAMLRCRDASDPQACHRRVLTERHEQPAGPPTIIRGGRSK